MKHSIVENGVKKDVHVSLYVALNYDPHNVTRGLRELRMPSLHGTFVCVFCSPLVI